MLKPEEMQKRLESARKVKPWVEARIERLRDADPTTRAIGLNLLGVDAKGKIKSEEDTPYWGMWSRGADQLHKLSSAELLKLGEAMFPRFTDAFRAAWEMHVRLPVQIGYG